MHEKEFPSLQLDWK